MKRIWDRTLDILFPPACPLCGDIIGIKGKACDECASLLSPVAEPTCLKCGAQIFDEEKEFCQDCTNKTRSYVRGFPALNYEGDIMDSVAAFKYHGKKIYSHFFAEEIVTRHGQMIEELDIEALVPVPVHKRKLKKRGYNQAEVLAHSLSKKLGIPVDSELIVRNINTLPQKKLNDIEREQNLKCAFISTDKRVQYNRVMLVDDIYTTGATVEACTQVLIGRGIKDVYYTSICIGKGY